jgi:hypothetical protein
VSSENDQLPFPARTCRNQRAAVLTSPRAWATAPHMVLVINSPGPGVSWQRSRYRCTACSAWSIRPARSRPRTHDDPMAAAWSSPVSNASARASIRRTLSASPSSRPSAPQLAARPHVANSSAAWEQRGSASTPAAVWAACTDRPSEASSIERIPVSSVVATSSEMVLPTSSSTASACAGRASPQANANTRGIAAWTCSASPRASVASSASSVSAAAAPPDQVRALPISSRGSKPPPAATAAVAIWTASARAPSSVARRAAAVSNTGSGGKSDSCTSKARRSVSSARRAPVAASAAAIRPRSRRAYSVPSCARCTSP